MIGALLFIFALPAPGAAPDGTIPPGAPLLHVVAADGVQIYDCARNGGGYGWAFRAPEAKLLDLATQAQLGTHSAGPQWRWKDGSVIEGRMVESERSPEPGSVPWLLLAAHSVGEQTGALSGVTWVRRSDTHGGAAPATGCDAAHLGTTTRVRYTATYSFYGSASAPVR